MNTRQHILDELEATSPLLSSSCLANVYSVPQGYFTELHAEVIATTTMANWPIHNAAVDVPKGYFENMPSLIMQKIHSSAVVDEIEALSPTLASIGKHNVYQVPVGYFDSFSTKPPLTKGILVQGNFAKQILKYAVAACIVGMLGLGIYYNINKKPVLDLATAQAIKEGNTIIQKGSFDIELNSLSATELENYLTDNGGDVNAALVAAAANDEADLPTVDDYLVDENALNNFLQSNNLQN